MGQSFGFSGLARTDGGDTGRVAAVHLAGADAGGLAVLRIDDGVRLHVFGHGEGEQHVLDLLRRRLAAGDDLQVGGGDAAAVARLDQEAAGHRAIDLAGCQRIRKPIGQQQAQVLLGGEDSLGLLVGAGGDDHLGEDVGDQPGVGPGQAPVDGDDAAEGRDRVALQRPGIGRRQIAAHGDAAGVGVFDDDAGRGLELGDQLIGGVGVGDIVVAQLLALQLAGVGDAGAGQIPGERPRAVEGPRLVRVLAITQGLGQRAGDGFARRGGVADLLREPAGDGGVIGGGAGEGAGGEALPQGQIGGPVGLQGLQQLGDRGLVDADRDIAVVLRARADHGRAADVDVLDHGAETGARGNG